MNIGDKIKDLDGQDCVIRDITARKILVSWPVGDGDICIDAYKNKHRYSYNQPVNNFEH